MQCWLALLLASLLSLLTADALALAKPNKPLVIGVRADRHFPPFSWSDSCDGDKPLGVPLDIMDAVLGNLGISVQLLSSGTVDGPAVSLLELIEKNHFDATMLAGKRHSDFLVQIPEALYHLRMSVYVRMEDKSSLGHIDNLLGRQGLYLVERPSPVFYLLKRSHPEALADLGHQGNLDEVASKLLSKEIDYLITDRSVGSAYLVEKDLNHRVVRSEAALNVDIPLYMYISKRSEYVGRAADIAKELKRLKDSGEADMLMRKNMLRWLATSHDGDCSTLF